MRILLIGGINLKNPPRGGEEYKNQVLLRNLRSHYQCSAVDTVFWKSDPTVLFYLFYKILFFKYDQIIISASSRSSYRLIKFIYYFTRQINRTSYFVIGGYFPSALQKGIFRVKYYAKLKNIVVEGEAMRQSLISSGIKRVSILPNFKDFPSYKSPGKEKDSKIQFVFLSKICVDKGLLLILEAVDKMHSMGLSGKFNITFYGPIDPAVHALFDSKLTDNVKYEGFLHFIADPKNSYSVLSRYDCLLFPTMWKGEGFPGVIIDAFISGLAIIASDWNMNSEIVGSGENGLIIPPGSAESLAEAMIYMIENPEKVKLMKQHSLSKANEYHISNIWPKLENILEEK